METCTDFLVGRPSFTDGMARVLDFSGSLNVYNRSPSVAEADAAALRSDFAMVGADLQVCLERVARAQTRG
jgi:hypothetical protein